MVTILMMSEKMAILDLCKIKVFWKKGNDVIIFVHDVTNKILSRDSNYIAHMVMWAKFGNSSISMKEVIVTSIWPEKPFFFFEWWSRFKFNNLGLVLGTNLNFYTRVTKGLKLKVRKFWGLIPTFVKVTEEKLVGRGLFGPHPE